LVKKWKAIKVRIITENSYRSLLILYPPLGGLGGKQKGEPDNDSNLHKDLYKEQLSGGWGVENAGGWGVKMADGVTNGRSCRNKEFQ
jgi:hypothetical protein